MVIIQTTELLANHSQRIFTIIKNNNFNLKIICFIGGRGNRLHIPSNRAYHREHRIKTGSGFFGRIRSFLGGLIRFNSFRIRNPWLCTLQKLILTFLIPLFPAPSSLSFSFPLYFFSLSLSHLSCMSRYISFSRVFLNLNKITKLTYVHSTMAPSNRMSLSTLKK